MSPKTKFKLIRISIYLTGLLIILGTVFYNAWQIKEANPSLVQTEKGDLVVFTEKNYEKAELNLKFTEKIPENLIITLEKDFSVFLEDLHGAIYTEEELEKKLFEDNALEYPNGKIVKYQNKNHIIDKGQLREITDKSFLDALALNPKNLPEISNEKSNQITIGEPLQYQEIQDDFPERILIEKNGDFYLTGTEGCRPVYISNIQELIEKYNVQTVSLNSQSIPGSCYRKTENALEILCDFDLEKNSTGNIYRINLQSNNQKIDNFEKSNLKLTANPTLSELLQEAGNLFVK
jgi:hypothetical protein